MEDWQNRVHAEYQALMENVEKLERFLNGENTDMFEKLEPIDKQHLRSQLTVMQAYAMVLRLRIDRFLGDKLPSY